MYVAWPDYTFWSPPLFFSFSYEASGTTDTHAFRSWRRSRTRPSTTASRPPTTPWAAGRQKTPACGLYSAGDAPARRLLKAVDRLFFIWCTGRFFLDGNGIHGNGGSGRRFSLVGVGTTRIEHAAIFLFPVVLVWLRGASFLLRLVRRESLVFFSFLPAS